MHWFELALGVVIGGAIMFYIQPTIKDLVARAFGWEQQVAQAYRDRAKSLTASAKSNS